MFIGAQMIKNLPLRQVDLGLIPGSRRSPGEGNGSPLQYSCLGNQVDRRAWQATVHGVTKSWTWLSNFHFIGETYIHICMCVHTHICVCVCVRVCVCVCVYTWASLVAQMVKNACSKFVPKKNVCPRSLPWCIEQTVYLGYSDSNTTNHISHCFHYIFISKIWKISSLLLATGCFY